MAIQTALVVDDSRSARYILQRLLERQHIHVEAVGSAEAALDYLREIRPDVVFMDDVLPGMNGQEAVERIGADPRIAGIPVVMYTASDFAADTPPPLRRGVVGVLNKPFAPEDVAALLAKLGGGVPAPPVPARLVREPAAAAASPTSAPAITQEAVTPTADELSRCVAAAVAAEMPALRARVSEEVNFVTRLTLDGMRYEQNKLQAQLLEQRLPRMLALLDRRLTQRMESLQRALNERIESGGLAPLQQTQVTQIARSVTADAAQRPARESARRVAAELLRSDIQALNVRMDRLRRRFNGLIIAAVIAVLAAAVLGYFVGRLG